MQQAVPKQVTLPIALQGWPMINLFLKLRVADGVHAVLKLQVCRCWAMLYIEVLKTNS